MLHGCYPVGGIDHLDSVMILHAGWPVMRSAAVILTFHEMDGNDGCTIMILPILSQILSPIQIRILSLSDSDSEFDSSDDSDSSYY